ncbi:hypothetical protein BAE36_17295 [Rhizobium leguminosarum bv. trifolii]|nr:hypothetical protein BAE36_17295 [Rhizobium leguminosarum bv. trifolii]
MIQNGQQSYPIPQTHFTIRALKQVIAVLQTDRVKVSTRHRPVSEPFAGDSVVNPLGWAALPNGIDHQDVI